MTFTLIDWFAFGMLSVAVFFMLRGLFFTQMFTYTYGFTFTDKDGQKAYSEVQTLSMTKPNDISFFRLAQQSIRENGFRNYAYISDPQFQLAYAMYVNSCWRRTSVLMKAQEKKKKDTERAEATDKPADSTEVA